MSKKRCAEAKKAGASTMKQQSTGLESKGLQRFVLVGIGIVLVNNAE